MPPHSDPSDPWTSLIEAFATLPAPARKKPNKVTEKSLADAIAEALSNAKEYDLEDECVRFGLPPGTPNEDRPVKGKFRYVRRRLAELPWDDLVNLGWRVNADYEMVELTDLLGLAGSRGVDGELKNLIFAANGPKPQIVLDDAVNNVIKIVKYAEYCLVYDRPLGENGLTWKELVSWWGQMNGYGDKSEREIGHDLYRRLYASMKGNEAEQIMFEEYCKLYRIHGFDVPALVPQVYLHYDPYTKSNGATLMRQRMDFLILLPNKRRVVLELDGKHHYADENGKASPPRYAEMVLEDRKLRLAGYEVYRFGGMEFIEDRQPRPMLQEFFQTLLGK